MQRMFGDGVCANNASSRCVLSPPVNKLMERINRAMGSGHCFGFSVLALRFAQKLANPADFGQKNVADLKIEGNDKLQREIAYSFAFQFFDPVNQNVIEGTPNQVLDKLIENLSWVRQVVRLTLSAFLTRRAAADTRSRRTRLKSLATTSLP